MQLFVRSCLREMQKLCECSLKRSNESNRAKYVVRYIDFQRNIEKGKKDYNVSAFDVTPHTRAVLCKLTLPILIL